MDIKPIIDNLKDFIIPLIAGLIIFPVKAIFEFKGIIYQKPSYNSNGNIRVKFSYRSSDNLNNVVIGLNLSDTTIISHDLRSGVYVDRIPSDQSFRNSTQPYITTASNSTMRRVFVPELDQGEYLVLIPVTHKERGKNENLKKSAIVEFRQEIEKKDDLSPLRTRSYRLYYFTFFHPWLTSISLFAIALIVQLIIKKRKPKPNI
jgi:hypothetical protein